VLKTRRILGPKRGEVIDVKKKWHDELHLLYFVSDIVGVIKLIRMWLRGHLRHVEGDEKYKILVGKP
jgi:hypothetical protein